MIDLLDFVKVASEIAQSPFVFAILLIIVGGLAFWYLYRKVNKKEDEQTAANEEARKTYEKHQKTLLKIMDDNNRKSEARENLLMEHNKDLVTEINKFNNSLEDITGTVKEVSTSVSNIQKQQEMMQLKNDKEFERLWDKINKD
ncbi:involved in bacteriocin production or immunity [Bacillus phage PBC4]|uniref:Uncharacterized protein n=1 Tax=Bacillus phage PBC4 TaxID=1675028 RepID=A0A1D6X865_9CAUD|nr:involved in bacteriocin production or immunity [Bacillus phage PBC4]AKQ08216.1 hypothetical protein PBC4_024 [Bacillus phage PBC4]QSJ04277.1 hypothetical protein BCP6_072 [Bacillus phage BCP6]WEM05691.1 hypothetical protein BSG01_052 [Bacillus phage BSG01]